MLPLVPHDDGKVRWFGPSWGAPICDPLYQVLTPVDEPCSCCARPIAEGQQGFTLIFMGEPVRIGNQEFTTPGRLAYHKDCLLRSILPESYWSKTGQ